MIAMKLLISALAKLHRARSAGMAFLVRRKACAAGRGDNSRRARAVYLGLGKDYELDKNF
jgi:hypothetical protein